MQSRYKHLHIYPNGPQMVHFRGYDYFMADAYEHYEVGEFVLVSVLDTVGSTMEMFTEKIEKIEFNKSGTREMLIMSRWSVAEEIFSKLHSMKKEERASERTSFIPRCS